MSTHETYFRFSSNMKMICMRKAALLIYIAYIMGTCKSKDEKVFAVAGCNVTLEWKLGNSSFETMFYQVNVFNSSGINIAKFDYQTCETMNDSSVYCNMSQRGEEWLLSVVLIYVTPVNKGMYTGQMKCGSKTRNITKELIVIDRPQIIKPQQIILTKPLNITCTIEGKLEDVNYRWKLNETDLNSTGLVYARSSDLLFESSWTVEQSSIFSCEVCKENSCCITSEPFVLDPYYGPNNVDLSLNESDIYLKDNETFIVKCFADCNPVCSFWWEGNVGKQNEELVISSFDSKNAGPYMCYARNLETAVMAKSKQLILHHAEVVSKAPTSQKHSDAPSNAPLNLEQNGGPQVNLLTMGIAIVAVILIISSCLIFVMIRRKCISRKLGNAGIKYARTLHQSREIPANIKVSRELLSFEKRHRPLPIPPEQDNTCRRINGSWHQNGRRKSRSLQTLFEHTKYSWNPVRKSLSLRTLKQLSLDLNNSFNESVKQKPQEDLYSSIDEVYDYAGGNEYEENLHEDGREAEVGNYNYDYAILPGV